MPASTAQHAGVARLVLTHLAPGLAPRRRSSGPATVYRGAIEVATPGSMIEV